jgi:hypothetical protein
MVLHGRIATSQSIGDAVRCKFNNFNMLKLFCVVWRMRFGQNIRH